mmetsp:Transcript_17251/g.26377  ORF Transcript_17251/g.26377 Transcript_17251/m.26377 type:complete len:117 (+) Transcript_17251:152-502(+)
MCSERSQVPTSSLRHVGEVVTSTPTTTYKSNPMPSSFLPTTGANARFMLEEKKNEKEASPESYTTENENFAKMAELNVEVFHSKSRINQLAAEKEGQSDEVEGLAGGIRTQCPRIQ